MKLSRQLFPFLLAGISALLFIACAEEKIPSADIHLNSSVLRFDGPAKFAAIHSMIRTRDGEQVPGYKAGDLHRAYQKAQSSNTNRTGMELEWQERGPANVGGRTRGLIVDPSDTTHYTWYAGSAGGGVWRTENAGQDWELLTPNIPNLATSSIAMSAANTDVIYVGTGEGFGNIDGINGSGIWKSTNRGASWSPLAATLDLDFFENVTRLIINPADENEILASTIGAFNNGNRVSYIMKSTDGGSTWDVKHTRSARIQQLVYAPSDFNTMYATINSVGVIKSEDAGETWTQVFAVGNRDIERIEMAISRLDAGVAYLSCETSDGSALYFTRDTFRTTQSPVFDGRQADWLGGQGWYDNTIAVHPYNDSMAWMAGAGSMLEIKPGVDLDTITVYDEFNNETTFLTEIENSPFTDEAGGLASDLFNGLPVQTQTTLEDLVDVNIYFGPGRGQKAHLMDVDLNYFNFTFNTMVDVPFEAWDTVNNRQVAISIFDVDGDGEWTYTDYTGQANPFHDVVTINTIDYVDTGSLVIQTINPVFKAQYYFFLQRDTSYQGTTMDFPGGHLAFTTKTDQGLISDFKPITDGYFQYTDIEFVGSKGVHVDHHNIIFIPLDDTAQTFYLLNANDGGVAFSEDNAETFIQTGETFNDGSFTSSYGYNISQFYGVDKMNGGNRYIGGTQDNGTWISDYDPGSDSRWTGAPSGDGFECAWHYIDTNQILETSQFNGLYKSYDGGNSWSNISVPGGEGPFITRVSASQIDPDLVFMAGEEGLIKSTNFGDTWRVIVMPASWEFNNYGPPTEISQAKSSVVWSGGRMSNDNRIAVSTDRGETFTETSNYGMATTGVVTGIASHPVDSATAYALFSFANGPKILKTEDLGQTWNDISGFVTNIDESTNGFPDVATYCLLVMPWNVDHMWAGTEIGLFESVDGGATWAVADNGLPAVSIWEMKIVGDEIVLATHGRGVWSLDVSQLNPVGNSNVANRNILEMTVFPNPMQTSSTINFEMDQKEEIHVLLYDINGKMAKQIFKGERSAGTHQLKFNRTNLITGNYFISIQSASGQITKQIVIN